MPPELQNDAGVFIAKVPAWWHPAKMPKQAQGLTAMLTTLLAPGTRANGALLFGPAGHGKTSGALGLGYAWGKAGQRVAFYDFGELMLRTKATWRKNPDETTEAIHKELLDWGLLILDDVGKQTTNESLEFLSTLVNARINRGRPTICTTNHDLDTDKGVADFCAACDSRVFERYQKFHVAVKGGANLRAQA